jgi:hypothetical protein
VTDSQIHVAVPIQITCSNRVRSEP